jgi:hypothetical protein
MAMVVPLSQPLLGLFGVQKKRKMARLAQICIHLEHLRTTVIKSED